MTLTDDITRDLTQRLGASASAAEPWTLAALSQRYGVSPTPIRQAIARLVAAGLLVRNANGRLVPATKPGRGSSPVSIGTGATGKGATQTRREAQPPMLSPGEIPLAEIVEREVFRKSLRGEHAFLREEAFAERLGVGRTRLRRVLHELAGAGVVQHVERCGFRTRPFQRDDMLAFLDVRATLEVQALDLAKSQLREHDLDRFLQGNDAAAVAACAIDNGLHAYFVEKANNHYLASFFASHGRYYSRLFDFATVDAGRLQEMAGQHTEILEQAQAGRFARARRALRHHIHSQAPVLSTAMERLVLHPEGTPSNE